MQNDVKTLSDRDIKFSVMGLIFRKFDGETLSDQQEKYLQELQKEFAKRNKSWYNTAMKYQYTAKQIREFMQFAKRHQMRFANTQEFLSAIAQYFKSWYNKIYRIGYKAENVCSK